MWKHQSDDMNNISLHDHSIDELVIHDGDISLIFNNGFDIAKTHPLNSTGQSKLTGKAQIILKCAKFLHGTIYSSQSEEREITISMMENKIFDFEVLEFKIEDNLFSLHGIVHEKPNSSFDSAELTFRFSDIVSCWNEYNGDSWFEDSST